ncbi:PrgI family protein [Antrihabitans sp. YC3-6]|uniref:PrgI family protein n=1 Tax=Antrihabitans stalagmiti TaxID=2799499 RepID=A0A934U6U9_9NOCA|nr:SCO6880 family protein [Antrihabitans stalagmiti]MBJ8342901.1 PrgI family protein [Antrihabitans stalagmiti]
MSGRPQRQTYIGWSQPKSAFLAGMGLIPSIYLLVIFVIWILSVYVIGLASSLVLALVLLATWGPLVLRIEGKTTYEWVLLYKQWRKHVRKGEDMYRSGLFSRVPGRTCRLPGVLYPTRLHEGWVQHQSRQVYGVIEMPSQNQFTVVIECWPQGNEAIDQDAVDDSVFNWTNFLNFVAEPGDIDGATVIIETGPETGNRIRREVRELCAPSRPGGDLPAAMMAEAAAMLPSGSVRMWARVAITFRATTADRRKDAGEQIKEMSRRMGGVLTVLNEANLNPRLLPPEEIVSLTKRAYSPSTLADLELGEMEGGHDIGWEDSGPMGHQERISSFYHDGCWSTTWEMSKAPASAVTETVLRPLLDVNGDLVRKRVAIVYRPHSPADAAAAVDSDYKNALSGRNGQRGIGSVEANLKVEYAEAQREEQGRGHGLTLFGVLVTVTTPEDGDRPRADSITKQLGVRARLRLRRVYFAQAASFAATLGIGVLLPDHESVSRKLAS